MNLNDMDKSFFDAIVKAVPYGVYGIDESETIGIFKLSRENHLLDCNVVFLTLTGYLARSQVRGVEFSKLFSQQRTTVEKGLTSIRSKEAPTIHRIKVNKNVCKLSFRLLEDDSIVGFLVDFTAEAEFKKNLRKFHLRVSAFTKNNDFVWVEDNDGVILSCNQKTLTYCPVDPRGCTWAEVNQKVREEKDLFLTFKDFSLSDYQSVFLDDVTDDGLYSFFLREIIFDDETFLMFVAVMDMVKNSEVVGKVFKAKNVTRMLELKKIPRLREEKIDKLMALLPENNFTIDLKTATLNKASDNPKSLLNSITQSHLRRIVAQCSESSRFGYIDTVNFTVETLTGDGLPIIVYVKPVIKENKVTHLKGVAVNVYEEVKGRIIEKEDKVKCEILQQNSSDILWTLDYKKQKIIHISPSVEKVLGYTMEEASANGTELLCPVVGLGIYNNTGMAGELKKNRDIVVETRCFTKTNEDIDMEIVLSPVIIDGELVRVHGSNRVISKRKALEMSLVQSVLVLQQSTKLLERLLDEGIDVKHSFLNEIIEKTGEAAVVDRAYIFEYNEKLSCFSQTHEWTRSGIKSQLNNPELQCVYYQRPNDPLYAWRKTFAKNEIVRIDSVPDLPPDVSDVKKILERQDILSLIAIKIPKSSKYKNTPEDFYGFVGFDECTEVGRKWTKYDELALQSCAVLIGYVLNLIEQKKELGKKRIKFREKMNKIGKDTSELMELIKHTSSRYDD